MSTIYWFKDKGLFTGHPRDIGLTTDLEVEHACDAMIKDFVVVKNRYGGNPRITQEAISDLYMAPLATQYELFKSL